MKLLADENIECEMVDALRMAGHDITDLKATSPGIEDADVLNFADDLAAVLITYDKDFGELIFRDRRVLNGVVLLRFGKLEITEKIDLLIGVLKERGNEILEAFTVITSTGIRMRK